MTDVLVQAAHPKRILFGSQARGEAAEHSDFDIMVVEENPANRFAEMVRLNSLIRSFDIAVDLLVVSEEKFQYWRDTPGNVYYEAATDGQVLYEGIQPLGLTAWVETDNLNQTRTMDGF